MYFFTRWRTHDPRCTRTCRTYDTHAMAHCWLQLFWTTHAYAARRRLPVIIDQSTAVFMYSAGTTPTRYIASSFSGTPVQSTSAPWTIPRCSQHAAAGSGSSWTNRTTHNTSFKSTDCLSLSTFKICVGCLSCKTFLLSHCSTFRCQWNWLIICISSPSLNKCFYFLIRIKVCSHLHRNAFGKQFEFGTFVSQYW